MFYTVIIDKYEDFHSKDLLLDGNEDINKAKEILESYYSRYLDTANNDNMMSVTKAILNPDKDYAHLEYVSKESKILYSIIIRLKENPGI